MDRRGRFAEGLSELYLPVYMRLCQVLPPRWQPYCGLRTFPEQKRLYDQGRVNSGKIVTDAGPGTSPHNYGCASDWTLFDAGGKPIWLDAGDPAWQEYADACKLVGARWGIVLKSGVIDSPHNELAIKVKWHDVYDEYLLHGTVEALKYAAAHRISLLP